MTMTGDEIQRRIRDHVENEILHGSWDEGIQTTTPLVSTGILDSIATLRLMSFLEREFEISMDPHDIEVDDIDTVERMADLVLGARGA